MCDAAKHGQWSLQFMGISEPHHGRNIRTELVEIIVNKELM
jgi:hypothetical protein